MDETKYRQLKRRAEVAASEAAEARGALRQAMQRLEEEHGCTLKDAERKLAGLQKEEEAAEKELNAAIAKYEKEFGDD